MYFSSVSLCDERIRNFYVVCFISQHSQSMRGHVELGFRVYPYMYVRACKDPSVTHCIRWGNGK